MSSKRKELSEKYESIRNTVQSNVETIRTLVEQAHNLTVIIEGTNDPATKEKLTESVNRLYKTIDTFVEESNKLFDQYLDFANSVVD